MRGGWTSSCLPHPAVGCCPLYLLCCSLICTHAQPHSPGAAPGLHPHAQPVPDPQPHLRSLAEAGAGMQGPRLTCAHTSSHASTLAHAQMPTHSPHAHTLKCSHTHECSFTPITRICVHTTTTSSDMYVHTFTSSHTCAHTHKLPHMHTRTHTCCPCPQAASSLHQKPGSRQLCSPCQVVGTRPSSVSPSTEEPGLPQCQDYRAAGHWHWSLARHSPRGHAVGTANSRPRWARARDTRPGSGSQGAGALDPSWPSLPPAPEQRC